MQNHTSTLIATDATSGNELHRWENPQRIPLQGETVTIGYDQFLVSKVNNRTTDKSIGDIMEISLSPRWPQPAKAAGEVEPHAP